MANLSSFTGSGSIKLIQRGNSSNSYSVAGGGTTGSLTWTVTITSVNTSKAMLMFSQTGSQGVSYSAGSLILSNGQFARGTITNSTTLTFTLPSPQLFNSNQDGFISSSVDWQVIEFN